jgi:hypothetical protein
MPETPLLKKLGIKPGKRMLILNAPEGYMATLAPLPEDTIMQTQAEGTGGTFDFVQVFVRDKADLHRSAPIAIQAVKSAGLLWFTYPKKTSAIKSDISRDVLWEELSDSGVHPVTMIAIDDTWSALRFRPNDEVGK